MFASKVRGRVSHDPECSCRSDVLVNPNAAQQEQCLRAMGLVKSFRGRKVVKGVGVEVYAGEVVGLLGPNGAGKTTIFRHDGRVVPAR